MKQVKLKTVEELYKVMRQQGIDPEDVRRSWRRKYTIDTVWRSQVDHKFIGNPPTRKLKSILMQIRRNSLSLQPSRSVKFLLALRGAIKTQ